MVTPVPVTIDPRRHDAILFDLDGAPIDAALADRLRDGRVGTDAVAGTGASDPAVLLEAAHRLAVRPGRCAVVTARPGGVAAARAGGFALVIGVGDAVRRHGADVVVNDLRDVAVRIGDRRMSELPDAMSALGGIAGRRPAVFFDFDGTLSEIVDDPDAARLTADAGEALQRLAARCPVAVLSGRDLADVCDRVGVPGIWYAGSHGFELTGPDGAHHQNDAAAAAVAVLAEAAARLRGQLGAIAGVMVEHKRFAVAVHYRNVARERVAAVIAAVRGAGQQDGLRVTTGREVIELRPDLDWDKGKTLRWILDRDPGHGSAVPIYVGDDITDEDAFDAIGDDGIPIVVRHSDDGDRATAARFALDSPAQVSEFTRRLAGQLNEG